jgi:hypothetical protein
MNEPKILHLWTELDFKKISKNTRHRVNFNGGTLLVNTNNLYMNRIIEEIDVECKIQEISWADCKTWIFILCSKKSEKGDALNTIDILADCIKVGIGIDDNKYATITDYQVNPDLEFARLDYWIIQADQEQIVDLAAKFLRRALG